MNKRDYLIINAVANGCAIIFEGEQDKQDNKKSDSESSVADGLDFDPDSVQTDEDPDSSSNQDGGEETPDQEQSDTDQPAEDTPEETPAQDEPAPVADELKHADPEDVNSENTKLPERMDGLQIATWYVDNGYFLNLMKYLHSRHLIAAPVGSKVNPKSYQEPIEGSLTNLYVKQKINATGAELAKAVLILVHSIPALFDMIAKGEPLHIPSNKPQTQEQPKEQPQEQPQQEPAQEAEPPAETEQPAEEQTEERQTDDAE